MNNKENERFIESWGSMGVLWGINRSMARVHAFILLSEDPVDLDTVANGLNISRGNASMCLKELRNWAVIKRIHLPGDRRDFYEPEPDTWKMFFNIAVEKKKREFDPALYALRNLLTETNTEGKKKVNERLMQMETIFTSMNMILNKLLENEQKSRTFLNLLKGLTPK